MIVEAQTARDLEKMLLIGAEPALRDQVEKMLPSVDLAEEDALLAGMMRVSREEFDLILVHTEPRGEDLEAALRGFRKVKPQVPVLLLTQMLSEPAALNLTQRGLAIDYLVLPLYPRDLETALRKHFPPARTGDRVGPTSPLPLSRLIKPDRPVSADESQVQDSFVGELTELIHAAERGLGELLERICWSAVFLCRAKAARITVGEQTARAGEGDRYDLVMPLIDSGNEIGKLELAAGEAQAPCSRVAGHIEQLIPGLIRLASSRGKLQEMANTDPLTGLANRRQMQDVLENLVARAKQERSRVTLVLFDFDDFKHYNDAYGHGAGDEILRESAMLIKRCIRRQDLAARFGGDEFAVVLWDWQERRVPNSEHPRSAMVIMERFRKLLKNHFFHRLGPQAQGALTISGGLASFPWDCSDVNTLIERADEALLEAKRSGKDRIYLVGQGPEAAKNL